MKHFCEILFENNFQAFFITVPFVLFNMEHKVSKSKKKQKNTQKKKHMIHD